ncbi:hypothetical protein DER44DRAFT_679950 [Fusarium oxysporum]|nr:hypothetical protein DER44DRAFT_679950 [Fusarium oxysporum]
MASPRLSNIQRGRRRQECREMLSKHVRSRLGVSVEPSEIRLSLRPTDPYKWEILSGKEESLRRVFAKKLSDHSIGTYNLLCEEVGVTFEAVSKAPSNCDPGVYTPLADESFSSRIAELKGENENIHQQLHEWKDRANKESERRRKVDAEAS